MMELMTERLCSVVREEYRVLLRAEAELILPVGLEEICSFYRKTGEACISWAVSAEGERIRAAYQALSDHVEKARFPTSRYRLICRPVWENEGHAAWVCSSVLTGRDGMESRRTMSQVWNLYEQTVLPTGQILRLCPPIAGASRRPPFSADGVYPQNGVLIFYRNPTERHPAAEFQIPYRT